MSAPEKPSAAWGYPMLRCDKCGREGSRGFHRVVMVHPKPDKWFCDNYRACQERIRTKQRG